MSFDTRRLSAAFPLLFAASLVMLAAHVRTQGEVNIANLRTQRVVMTGCSIGDWRGEEESEDRRVSAGAYRNVAVAFLKCGRPDLAIAAGRASLRIMPADPLAEYWLGRAYWDGGSRERAREAWKAGGVYQPQIDHLLLEGWHYSALGQVTRAQSLFQQAIDLAPEEPGPYDALASLLWGKDWERVQWALGQAISVDKPGTASWYWNSGRRYLLEGNWAAAARALEHRVQLSPDEWPMRFLADAQQRAGETEAASHTRQRIDKRWGPGAK